MYLVAIILILCCTCGSGHRSASSQAEWLTVLAKSKSDANLTVLGLSTSSAELIQCGVQGTLVRSRNQGPLRLSLNYLPAFSKVRVSMRVAFIDQWNEESLWVTANSVEIWRLKSSWRQHGSPTCVGPYSDYFVDFSKEFDVQNGTSSLQFVLASNLRTGVNVASFGFTSMVVDVLQTGEFIPSNCQYNVETDVWYEINMVNWQANQLATLECADGTKVACGDWFNRYACQLKEGVTCPAPRKLLLAPQTQSDSQPNVTCCSLGKSCTTTGSQLSSTTSAELSCEYLYNNVEDTSFVDIKINDMTTTVKLECANGRVFRCVASQWGKYTCSFKDKAHINHNPDNLLCPEPRNAIIDGQCCNLGKGCEKLSSHYGLSDPYYNSTETSIFSSGPTLITLAAFCGLVAISAVIMGAVVLYKRAKAGTIQYSKA